VLLAGLALHAFAQTIPPLSGQVVIPDHGKWAPNFLLADQTGRLRGPQSFRGRVVVMTFLDSHCTQDCPVIGKELTYVQRKLGPSIPLTLLVVSVAPYTDSPASAATFAIRPECTRAGPEHPSRVAELAAGILIQGAAPKRGHRCGA